MTPRTGLAVAMRIGGRGGGREERGGERGGRTNTALWNPSLLRSVADDGVECVLC